MTTKNNFFAGVCTPAETHIMVKKPLLYFQITLKQF